MIVNKLHRQDYNRSSYLDVTTYAWRTKRTCATMVGRRRLRIHTDF